MPISKAISIREEVESLGNSLARITQRAQSIVDDLDTNYDSWDNDRFSDVEKEFLEFQAFCDTLAQSFDKLPMPHVSYAPYKEVVPDFKSKSRRAMARLKGVQLPEEVVMLGYSGRREKIGGQIICMAPTGQLYLMDQWDLEDVALPREDIKWATRGWKEERRWDEQRAWTGSIEVFTIPKRISEVVHAKSGIDLIPLSLPLPAMVAERWPWARLHAAVAHNLEAWTQSLKPKTIGIGR